MNRLNIGCGMSPTKGYINFDNSLSIRLAKFGSIGVYLHYFGLINKATLSNILFCKYNRIEWADVSKKIPVRSNTVDILYSSHMLEHLDQKCASLFLQEAMRVLKPNGTIRIVVPDLERIINDYNRKNDADQLITSMHVCNPKPISIIDKIKAILVGPRHHQWMYDKQSLSKLLVKSGFVNPVHLNPGETTMHSVGLLNLSERSEESIYIEANKPAQITH